jgi:hypothetical protein
MTRFKRDAHLPRGETWACSTCHDGLLATVMGAVPGGNPSGAGLPKIHPHSRVVVVRVKYSSRTLAPCLQLCRKCSFVGMRNSTWGRVNDRKPRSCNTPLPAGRGEGVASAMRQAWTRPPWVSRRQRRRSRALTSRTFLTVWSLGVPLSLACCAAGSWGRTLRRAVSSWAQGGPRAWRRVQRRRGLAPPPAACPRGRRPPPRRRGAGRGRAGNGPGHRRGAAGPPAAPGGGHGSTRWPGSGPCRTGARAPPAGRRAAPRPAYTAPDPPGAGRDRAGLRCNGGPSGASRRGAPPP